MGDPPAPGDAHDPTVEAVTHDDDMVGTVAPATPGADAVPAGTAIGRYVVLERLGAGGMGVVYKAYDPEIDRAVAIKLLRGRRAQISNASLDPAQARLLREAKSLGRLAHPNVVTVHDVGTHEGAVFVAMELVSGPNLADWIEAQPRSLTELLATMIAAGRGLAAAHAAGIVHRDFKPSNAVIGDDDGRVRVLDFGLAREDAEPASAALGGSSSLSLTVTGAVMGTPRFMSPEQLAGDSADERSDQFSFCLSLWWALYGEHAFAGDTLAALGEATRTQTPRPPAQAPREVPGWIRELLLRGLRFDPAERHASLDHLLDALARDPRRQQRRVLFGLGIAALAGVAVFGLARNTSTERDLCRTAPAEVAAVWNPAISARLGAAFTASNSPLAADAIDRVNRTIGAYTDRWAAHRTEACQATHVRGTQSAELLDLRMRCLDRRLAEVDALVDVWLEDPSAEVVTNAAGASHQLGPLDDCDDPEALRAATPLPSAPEARAQIEALSGRVRRQQALLRAGKYTQLLIDGTALEQQVEDAAFPPLSAGLLLVHGEARAHVVKIEAARETLEGAITAAARAHDDFIAARAWTWLMFVIGVIEARPEEALAHRLAAEFAATRADDPVATIWLESTIAALLTGRGKAAEARALLERAVAMLGQSTDPLQRVSIRNNLGANLQAGDELEAARAEYQRAAVEARTELGDSHPGHAFVLLNEGTVASWLGDHDAALASCRQGRRISEPLESGGGAETARALVCEAAALVGLGRPAEAMPLLQRAEELSAKHEAWPEFRARRQFVHAEALWETGGDLARARALAREALAFYRASPETPASVLARMEAWLAAH